MNWSKSQKWDPLKATIICQKKGYWVFLVNQNRRKNKKNLENVKIKKNREDFNKMRDRFLKPKIKEIRKYLYELGNKENLSESKIKEIEKNLFELEKSVSRHKKNYDYDDAEYKWLGDVGNLFNQSIDEDYYKPIKPPMVLIIRIIT